MEVHQLHHARDALFDHQLGSQLLSPLDALVLTPGGLPQPQQQAGGVVSSTGWLTDGQQHPAGLQRSVVQDGAWDRYLQPTWQHLAAQQLAAGRREAPGTPLGSSHLSAQQTWATNATSIPATPGASPTRVRSATASPQVQAAYHAPLGLPAHPLGVAFGGLGCATWPLQPLGQALGAGDAAGAAQAAASAAAAGAAGSMALARPSATSSGMQPALVQLDPLVVAQCMAAQQQSAAQVAQLQAQRQHLAAQKQQLLAILGKQAPGLGLPHSSPPAGLLPRLAAEPLGSLEPAAQVGSGSLVALQQQAAEQQLTPTAARPPPHPFVAQQHQQQLQLQQQSPQQAQPSTPGGHARMLAPRQPPTQPTDPAAGAAQALQPQLQPMHPWVQRQLQLQQHGLQQKLQAALHSQPLAQLQPAHAQPFAGEAWLAPELGGPAAPGMPWCAQPVAMPAYELPLQQQVQVATADTWAAPNQALMQHIEQPGMDAWEATLQQQQQQQPRADQADQQLPGLQATADGWGMPFGQQAMAAPSGATVLARSGWQAAAADAASGWGQPFSQQAVAAGDAASSGWGAVGNAGGAWAGSIPQAPTERLLQQQAQQPEPVQIVREGQAFIMMTDVQVMQRFWTSLEPALRRLQPWRPPRSPGGGMAAHAEPVLYQVLADPAGQAALGGADVDAELQWLAWPGAQPPAAAGWPEGALSSWGSGMVADSSGGHFHCVACQVDLANEQAVMQHLAGACHAPPAQPEGWGDTTANEQPSPRGDGAGGQGKGQRRQGNGRKKGGAGGYVWGA